MAVILNIETSEKICSVALSDEGKILAIREKMGDKVHASELTILINELFEESNKDIKELNAVAVSKGPGSYTGLRIGVSTAKGICYGLNIPLISISTLQVLCEGALMKLNELSIANPNEIWLCPMIDARRLEVYRAFYNIQGDVMLDIEAEILNEQSYSSLLSKREIVFFGSGMEKCKALIHHSNALFIENLLPSASYMVKNAHLAYTNKMFENTAYFEPFYLKDFVVTKSKKNLLTSTR